MFLRLLPMYSEILNNSGSSYFPVPTVIYDFGVIKLLSANSYWLGT